MSDIPIANFVASGGITGAVVVVSYMVYKLCKDKRFKSSCCGATMEVKEDTHEHSPVTPKLVVREPEKKPDATQEV
jgi:hypothetical protein